jgi:hypothetical protein
VQGANGSPLASYASGVEMPIAGTQGLLLHELCELYDAEHRFVEGQQEMILSVG